MPLPDELQHLEVVSMNPNRLQFLAPLLEDPDRLVEYMLSNCSDEIIQGRFQYYVLAEFLTPDSAPMDANSEFEFMSCINPATTAAVDEAARYATADFMHA